MARKSTITVGVTRGQLFSALTGRSGAGLAPGASIRDKLTTAFGSNRKGNVDTRTAAKELGVSQRTVQRWIAGEGRQRSAPKPATANVIDTKARQAATTKRGRSRAVDAMRKSSLGRQMSRGGGTITVRANQGPGSGVGYQRWRSVMIPITTSDGSNHMDQLWAAYEAGGDAAARAVIDDLAQDYCAGWQFGEVQDFSIDRGRF